MALATARLAAAAGGPLSLSGTVVNSVTGAPVRYATVTIFGSGRKAQTNAAGAFEFSQLEPGNYLVVPSKDGFDVSDETAIEMQVVLTESRRNKVLRLMPLGAIRGRVVDDSGDPVPNATVIALSSVIEHGRRRNRVVNGVPTNDRGEYRFGKLHPGPYLIQVSPETAHHGYYGKDAPAGSRETFAPLFFGGSKDAAQATAIAVNAGCEARADVEVRLQPGRTVRGRIGGYRPNTSATLQLSRGDSDLGLNVNSLDYATGQFEIRGVLDGTYRLRVYQRGDGDESFFAERTIVIAGNDVEGVALTLAAAPTLKGIVRVDGPDAPAPVWEAHLHSQDALLSMNETEPFRQSGEIDNGAFEIPTVVPGRYWIDSRTDAGQYIASARAGQTDLLATQELVVGPGATPEIEVVLRTDGGRVAGTVAQPASVVTAVVLLAPEGCNRPAEVTRMQQGAFEFSGIAPGRYRLYAWNSADKVDYGSPATLCGLARGGVPVEVTAGRETKVQMEKLMEEPK